MFRIKEKLFFTKALVIAMAILCDLGLSDGNDGNYEIIMISCNRL